jgi:hypothetical protein
MNVIRFMVAVADDWAISEYTRSILFCLFNMLSYYCDNVHNPQTINFKVNKHEYRTP